MKTPIQCQKLLGYAVIGYLDVLARTGAGDYEVQSIFGNLKTLNKIKAAQVAAPIFDLLKQLDEFEALRSIRDPEEFDLILQEMTDPLVLMLKSRSENINYDEPAVDRLL